MTNIDKYPCIVKALSEMGYVTNMFNHHCEQGNACHYADECITKMVNDVIAHFDAATLAKCESVLAHIATLSPYEQSGDTYSPFDLLCGGSSDGDFGDGSVNIANVLASYGVSQSDMLAVDNITVWAFNNC